MLQLLNSELKDLYRQNLLSRIKQYKGRKCVSFPSNNNVSESNESENTQDEVIYTPRKMERINLGVQSVRNFKDSLTAKGICKSDDGKVIDSKGKKTTLD